MPNRPKVALHIETSRAYGRELLKGVALFARTHTNWSLLHQEMTLEAATPDWMMRSSISGVIARVDNHNVDTLRSLKVPCIDVRCSHQFPGFPQVGTDNKRVAELAFQHLWERGFRRFAFCGFQQVSFAESRLLHFRKFVENSECDLSVYQSPNKPNVSLTNMERSGIEDIESMSEWLSSLKRPTGVFVCNDIRGQQVLNACRSNQIEVPDDLGVIGVDDDEAICWLCDPTLSSVRPDAEQVGFRAAEILNDMLNGSPAPLDAETIAPRSVVERLSTQVVAVEDQQLARVCRYIRQNACTGINVSDVTEFAAISRRQLERRFRDELGRTPHEEITAAQVSRVKQLLQETTLTLEGIAPLAGYSHKERLSSVFKRETGLTPGEFRRDHPQPK